MSIKSPLGRQLGTQFDSVFDVVKSNPIYDKSGGKIPSLDLNFAKRKSLRDSRSTENKITFNRASSATFVDSDGLIKTTPVNLLIYSEEFDHSSWTKNNSFSSSQVVNAAASPDGNNTAEQYTNNASGTNNVEKGVTVSAEVYTFSIYLKAATANDVGKYLTIGGHVSGSTHIRVLVQLPAEWTRFTASGTCTAATWVFGVDGRTNGTFTGLNQTQEESTFLVWGAQLEKSSVATDYIPTQATISGAPRFDHDPVTGESLGLLIEEDRTNEISADFSPNSPTVGLTSSEDTAVTKPDGTAGALKITATAGSSVHTISRNSNTTTTNHTFSVFVKKGNHRYIGLSQGGTSNNIHVVFDTDTKTITDDGSHNNGTFVSSGFEEYANGWFRIHVVGFTQGTVLRVFLAENASQNGLRYWSATGNEFAYVWGLQREDGTFPTSYIPTSGSTVTRVADIANIVDVDFAKTNLLQYSERFDDDAWFKANSTTITPNTIAAPDGSITAETFNRNSTSTGNYLDSTSVSKDAAPVTFTFSLFVKKNDARYASLRLQGTYPSRADVIFDLDTGTVAGTAISTQNFSNASGSIQSSGNGWFRVSLTATSDSRNQIKALIGCSAEANQIDGTSSVANSAYIWGAQLEEGDVLTDYTRSVETFVSRASSATYVDDATGLIKTSAVNLLGYSEEFNNAYWIKKLGASVVANNQTAPDGTLTADTVTFTQRFSSIRKDSVVTTPGTEVTLSFYAKNIDGNTNLHLRGSESGNNYLGTGITITSEWARYSVTYTHNGTTNVGFCFQDRNTSGWGSVAIWGAQMEIGDTAGDYIKSTSATPGGAARYENGELILEEARTNYATKSSSTLLTKSVAETVLTQNAFTAPDGTNTALRVQGNNGYVGIPSSAKSSVPAGSTLTCSYYIYSVNGIQNLKSRVLYGSGFVDNTFNVPAGAWIRHVANAITDDTGSDTSFSFRLLTAMGGASTSVDVYIWGLQVEVGAYATSQIPTNGSTVTRAADISTSALGVDSWYNQNEGTMFVEALNYEHPNPGTALVPLSYSDNSFTNLIQLGGSTGSDVFNFDTISGGTNTRATLGNYSSNKLKSAGAYKITGSAGSLDGAAVGTSSPSSIPSTINRLDIGNNHTGTLFINGHIKRFTYFNTRLSDDKLKSITT